MTVNPAVARRGIARADGAVAAHAVRFADRKVDGAVTRQLTGEQLRRFDAAFPLVSRWNAILRQAREARARKIDRRSDSNR